MFGLTWNNFKRLLLMLGIISPPKGTGKMYRVDITTVTGQALESGMRKTWQKAFKGSEYCADLSEHFNRCLDRNAIHILALDGVTYYKAKKVFSPKNSPFRVANSEDISEWFNDQTQKELRLQIARSEETDALKMGDSDLVAEKKLLVHQLEKELRGWNQIFF